MLALEDHWIWDSWYLHDGNHWHCWFLKAPKSIGDPALRHWNVTQGHAISGDLINWHYLGTSLSPASKPSWDDKTTWTGSTLRGDDDKWHYFYTGTRESEDAKIQRIGHATGSDLQHWDRVDDGLCLDLTGPNAAHYETRWEGVWHDRAMRDPWVMKNPSGTGWLMYFTARCSGVDEANNAGCIGFATSPDLYSWHLEKPIYTGAWGQLEVPQVFEYGGFWYCLFCMAPDHQAQWNIQQNGHIGHGNHYLISDSPHGPWQLPSGPGLDTHADRYAARILEHNGLQLIGFKDGESDDFGGYLMDPVPVYQAHDGRLSLHG